jgi:glycosyltransferase involved in cell wall biosynthesis
MNKPAGSFTVSAAAPFLASRDLSIVLVAPTLDILGGQGIQARSLLQALAQEGFAASLLPVNPRFPRGLGWLRRIPILRTLLNQLLYVASLSRLRHADVVHVFSASYWSFLLAPLPAMLAARLFGVHCILNYHSGEAADHLGKWGLLVHPWLALADEIVVPSVYLHRVFAAHGYKSRVIPNMIDTSAFGFRVRDPLRPLLLSNRNLESHYRVGNTLQAFALLRAQYPQAQLTVAGYGSEAAKLQAWVQEQGVEGVTFLGRVEPEAMPQLYAEADIYLNSSVIDNQPISILEAFAAGLPVISTATGDIGAMIVHRHTGILVPPDAPAAMTAAITALLLADGEATTLAANARKEVERYTWPAVCKAWTALYTRASA